MSRHHIFSTLIMTLFAGLWTAPGHAQITISGTEITFPDASTLSTADSDATILIRTIVVSPTPGDATASGTALRTAYNAVTGASASNPYVVMLEPGVYDIGSASLDLKTYVHLRGTSRESTIVRSSYAGDTDIGALDAESITVELSAFTLEITGTSNTAAIWCFNAVLSMEDVNVVFSNTITTFVYAIAVGGAASDLTMRDSRIEIPDFAATSTIIGLRTIAGTATLEECQIILNGPQTSTGATRVLGCDNRTGDGTTNLRNCRVTAYDTGATNAHGLLATGGSINAASTELFGSTVNAGPTNVKLVNCWDTSFNAITDL